MVHVWSNEEKAYLRKIVKGHHHKEIVELMNKKFEYKFTLMQIKGAIKRYKLNTGFTGYFKKGSTSFNKGKKQSEYMSEESIEKSKKGRFKKGNEAYNKLPIGSERIRVTDEYIEIKVAEPNIWMLKQRYIYEQVHGKIPKGMLVSFADGNKYNFDPDNLILLTKEQSLKLTRLNLRTEDKELTKTAVKVVDLYISIRNKEK